MNVTIWNELSIGLQEYLKSSNENVKVLKIPPQKANFDCIVIEEIANQYSEKTTCGLEQIDELGYEINIFIASNGASTEEMILSKDSRYSALCDKFMSRKGFIRTSSNPTPNIDKTIFRRTMRYSGKVKINTGKII